MGVTGAPAPRREELALRYFLVAPLDETPLAGVAAAASPVETSDGTRRRLRRDGTVMRSRIDYRENELAQTWTPLPVAGGSIGHDPDAVIESAWLAHERGRHVLGIFAMVPDGPAGVVALEARLTDLATDFAGGHPLTSAAQLLWVNRTALLAAGETAPTGWIDGLRERVDIEGRAMELGWGNSAIPDWGGPLVGDPDDAEGPDALRWQAIRGLVDAQAMWAELEGLSAGSAHVIRELFDDTSAAGRSRRFRQLLGDSERLAAGIAKHHLGYDDLLLSLQGPRRAIAQGSLHAWGYHGLLDRIARRMSDLQKVIESRKTAHERRYQRLVEGILSGLSLLTLLDLVLKIVGTALIGTDAVPGSGSPLGVFAALRAVDADALLLSGLTFALVAVVTVLVLRRRT